MKKLIPFMLLAAAVACILCACFRQSTDPSVPSPPSYPYEEISLEGKSFPVKLIEITNGTPFISGDAGTLLVEDGVFLLSRGASWPKSNEATPDTEEIRESRVDDAALSAAQFEAEGYRVNFILFYFHNVYLTGEKDGNTYLLPCSGRTDAQTYRDYGFRFLQPMPLEEFLSMVEKYNADEKTASASGGFGF